MTVYANNVASVLAADIGPTDTMLIVSAGQGSFFPAVPVGEYFWVTLIHPTTFAVEIVQCTARAADTLTVVRGRDNTTAIAFPIGTILEMRLTAQMMREANWQLAAGQPNGLPTLGADSKIVTSYFPSSIPQMVNNKVLLSNLPDELITDTELAAVTGPINTAIAGKANKAGDTFSGAIHIRAGAFGAQQGFQSYGWGNGVNRWFWVMEADAALSLYAYDTAGASPQQVARFAGASAGGGLSLQVGGSNVWTTGNFSPSLKVDTNSGRLNNPSVYRTGFSDAHGLQLFGNTGNYMLFDGSNFTLSAPVYAPNLVGTSDETLKRSIRRAPAVKRIGDMVELISWVWRRKAMKGAPKGRHRGVSAQSVQKYAPHHVHAGADGKLGVDKAGLALEVAVDNSARIRELEAELADLRALMKKR